MRAYPFAALVVAMSLSIVPALAGRGQDRGRIPQGPAGTVTLPVDDYDRLLDRAAQPPARPEQPPIASVVARAELRADVAGASVRGTLRIEGEVYRTGPVKVPLVSGATLIDATADGQPLPLLQEGDVHVAVFTGPGPFTATLQWAADVGSAPGRASFTLPQPVAGTTTAVIDLPGDPADVRVDHGLVTARAAAAGRTRIEATLAPAGMPRVSWSVREAATAAVAAEARLLADVKSLVTIGDADLRLVALVDITVVRGEPASFTVQMPDGYETLTVTGATLNGYQPNGRVLTLAVREPAARRHQFLLSFERPHGAGSFTAETSFPAIAGVQRETGEVAVEGAGTLELAASADETLRRLDVRETHASLRALARQPLLAAFRYQRRPSEARALTLDVKRFADAPVIAAVAERALATTLVTAEGRMLTEMSLQLRNRAQPFMKVTLPTGATMLSVEVAGEPARPVVGADGTRIPLLRAGVRPDAPYTVSFVYLHAGQAFAKRGDTQLLLPRVEVPITLVEWELFLPDRYAARPTGGNVIPAALLPEQRAHGSGGGSGIGSGVGGGVGGGSYRPGAINVRPGQIIGRVVDPTGLPLPGARITGTDGTTRRTAVTDADGRYVLDQVPPGRVTVTAELVGFTTGSRTFDFDERPRLLDFQMPVGALTETVTVDAAVPFVDQRSSVSPNTPPAAPPPPPQAPSQNVINLQRRVAGVLPVRVDVPRAGTSYRFVRPLVFEEETTVTFKYKSRR